MKTKKGLILAILLSINFFSQKVLNANTVDTLKYCSNEVGMQLGNSTASEDTFTIVNVFPDTTMINYVGKFINKVYIGVNANAIVSDVVIRIWTDTSNLGTNPVIADTVPVSSLIDGWNEIILSSPYNIDGRQIFVGYTCLFDGSLNGIYLDDQPAQPDGYSDILFDGETWGHTAQYINHNYQIKALIDDGLNTPDISLFNLTLPEASCSLSDNELVIASIQNVGATDITTPFNIAYKINNGAEITVPVNNTIGIGEIVDININMDLSTVQIHNIVVYSQLAIDTNNNNDTISGTTENTTSADLPYFQDFENSFSGWSIEYDEECDWDTIETTYAHSGSYAVNINCFDYLGYIFSECISLNSGNYNLNFWYKTGSQSQNLAIHLGNYPISDSMQTSIAQLDEVINETWVDTTISFSVNESGTYNLGFYIFSESANLMFDDVSITENTTSIKNKFVNNFELYPNPTTGIVYISDNNYENISVYNQIGQLVKTISHLDHIDISDLQRGSYIIKIRTKNNLFIKHIILSK